MNIDLFMTPHNEAGLVCDSSFAGRQIVGIILDAQTHDVTLEFSDMGETFHPNIPIAENHREKLLFSGGIFVGFLEGGLLAGAYEVPLLYLNDPYGSDFGQTSRLTKAKPSIVGFEQFMKRCTFAQAIHRENLGDEGMARSVLRGIDPHNLEYTPALLRQKQLAAMPAAAPATAPQVPGLGGSAASRQTRTSALQKKNDQEDSND